MLSIQGFPYPQAVKRLLCIKHIDSLALSLYPTNNHLDTRGRAFPSPPHLVGAGKYAMKIIDENQVRPSRFVSMPASTPLDTQNSTQQPALPTGDRQAGQ